VAAPRPFPSLNWSPLNCSAPVSRPRYRNPIPTQPPLPASLVGRDARRVSRRLSMDWRATLRRGRATSLVGRAWPSPAACRPSGIPQNCGAPAQNPHLTDNLTHT
jgi:hypothetical protein